MVNSLRLERLESFEITGIVRCILEDVKTGKKEVSEYKNLITDAGKAAIAARIANVGEVANEGAVTYGATGTGTTAPVAGDTTLETELARKLVASRSVNDGGITGTIRTFFNTSESNGSLKEYGLFIIMKY